MRFVIITFVLFGMTYTAVGQNSGYYRTRNSGRWNDISTWETSPDSTNWSNASATPDYNSNYIVLRGGDTVYVEQTVAVNQAIIEKDAVLIINGYGPDSTVSFHIKNGAEDIDMLVYGTIIATGAADTVSPYSVNPIGILSFEEGSVYDHNQNGGAIPLSTWKHGSTMKLTGTTDKRPANRAQDYSNIIVDLPHLVINVNMGFRDNIISGDINIFDTNQHRWVLVGPTSFETRTVTIMGDIYLHKGNFNTHGTDNPNSTAIVHTYGDVIVTGGNFSIARATQGFSGTTTWYLHGDLSISNAVTQNANPPGAKFVFTGPGEHKLTLDNVIYGPGGLAVEVDSAVLNIGTSTIGDSGMFNLTDGSVLICGNPGGLDSAIQTNGVVSLSTNADYVFNGTSPQYTGLRLPLTINNLNIDNPSGVFLSSDVLVNGKAEITSGNLLLNGKRLILGSNAELLETGGLATGISGKITTARDINSPDNLNIGNMGVYFSSDANPGMTLFERFHTPVNLNGTYSILRQYNITPANNSGLDATLRFYYDESELDTISEGNLGIFTSPDGAENTWQKVNGVINEDENYAEVMGVDKLSYWTLGYDGGLVSAPEETNQVPVEYSLYQNYPNPFNPETIIDFDLPEVSFVNLTIYNSLGEKVSTVIDREMEKGRHSQALNAAGLSSGMYIYRLSAGSKIFTRKMMLLK